MDRQTPGRPFDFVTIVINLREVSHVSAG